MRKGGEEATSILGFQGMIHPGDARRLRTVLGRLDGVKEVEVNYITSVVSIRYDSRKLSLLSIKAAILKARSER